MGSAEMIGANTFIKNNIIPFLINSDRIIDDSPQKQFCQNKKKGKKSEVYPYEVEDLKNMLDYFQTNRKFLHYLLLTFSCNMARRVGDTLSMRWYHVYDPCNGKIRENILEIVEDKTDKLANPKINSAVKKAIDLYIKNTGCDPSESNYSNFIFMQLSGTHKGTVLTESGHLKALKNAAKDIGISYNIGTHSARKFFGKMSRLLHPGDPFSMELLQTIYNHSDAKTTRRYIGLTKEKIDGYYDDVGSFFDDYISGDERYSASDSFKVISLDANDLRDILLSAYESGKNNANISDGVVHADAIMDLIKTVECLAK